MKEQTQGIENSFDSASLVQEAALTESKKKSEEAKSILRKIVDAGKKHIKQEYTPEKVGNRIASGIKTAITNKVKSSLTAKGPRSKSKR